MDLIDREALDKTIWSKCEEIDGLMLSIINNAPTVDAEPVRHGKWVEHEYAEEYGGQMISNWECSECHQWFRTAENYCGECGAKMDGD